MRKLALLLVALLAFIPASYAKDPRVAQAESWLKSLTYGQARFTQRGFDGTSLSGNFYIWRPGRLRFEYDAPVKDFIVADGVLIYFYDDQQRQTSTAPVGTTLADFLLRKNARLDGDLTVRSVKEQGGLITYTIQQTADPASGTLLVNFTQNPFQLKSWTIVDAQGLKTDLVLTDFNIGTPIPPSLFIYKDPTGRSRLNN
jgi:outer membrane lipoprotein-sorting protein